MNSGTLSSLVGREIGDVGETVDFVSTTNKTRKVSAMRNCAAFTLWETLIAIGIMAIFAAVVIPAMRSTENCAVESSARILAADLSLAIQHNSEWSIRLDTTNNLYELVHTGSGTQAVPVNLLAGAEENDGRYVVFLDRLGSSVSRVGGVQLAGAALKDSKTAVNTVTFGPLGGTGPSRSKDTVIWLIADAGIDVRFVRLIVSWVTGQV